MMNTFYKQTPKHFATDRMQNTNWKERQALLARKTTVTQEKWNLTKYYYQKIVYPNYSKHLMVIWVDIKEKWKWEKNAQRNMITHC